jgi:predicted esterase
MKNVLLILLVSLSKMSFASLPSASMDPEHPGSKIYQYESKEELIKCSKRDINIFTPVTKKENQTFKNVPMIIYGHGQALKIEHYRATLEHLAKKGIVAIFPTYDTGFFDRDWSRMARDYVSLTKCAIDYIEKNQAITIDEDRLIYSGHSKGAYVAGVAAGLSFKENLVLKPKAVMLFQPAGLDADANKYVSKDVLYHVIYSDKDKIVDKKISENIYNQVPVSKKQFFLTKSYPQLEAGHFWPLTKPSRFGGENENALHYHSAWKWLVAQANDLMIGGFGNDSFLFGEKAIDKGVTNLTDSVSRNW